MHGETVEFVKFYLLMGLIDESLQNSTVIFHESPLQSWLWYW